MAEESHKHLCAKCNQIFDCTNPKDAEFEFALCEDCKGKPKRKKSPK